MVNSAAKVVIKAEVSFAGEASKSWFHDQPAGAIKNLIVVGEFPIVCLTLSVLLTTGWIYIVLSLCLWLEHELCCL